MTVIKLSDCSSVGNLRIAHARAKRRKQHHKCVTEFEKNEVELLVKLKKSLDSGVFKTSEYTFRIINDSGKERVIAKLPYYPDRIVHHAYMAYLEPEFTKRFSSRSHASIPGRGIHAALRQVRYMLLHYPERTKYCFKMDVKKCFWNVDHEIMKDKLRELPCDSALYHALDELVDSFPQKDDLISGIRIRCGTGVPIGNYPSQYLVNYLFTDYDKLLERLGLLHVRYMDDICIFTATKADAHVVKNMTFRYFRDVLKMEIKDNWQVYPVDSRGVDFVGYRIFRNRVLYRKADFQRFRKRISEVYKHALLGALTDKDVSRIYSYAGWLRWCTPKARRTVYERYFEPVFMVLGESEMRKKVKEIMKL